MIGSTLPPSGFYELARKALMASAVVVAISPWVALGSLHGQRAGLLTTDPTAKAAAATSLSVTKAAIDQGRGQWHSVRISGPVAPQAVTSSAKHHLLAEPIVTLTPRAPAGESSAAAVTAARLPIPKPEPESLAAIPPTPKQTASRSSERMVFANRIDNLRVSTAPETQPMVADRVIAETSANPGYPEAGIAMPAVTRTPPVIDNGADMPAWLRHAVKIDLSGNQPKIAVVIDDLGLSKSRTQATIALPGPLTLAFLPYASDLKDQSAKAQGAGHELLVHVPMQPLSESQDPGPKALRTDLSKDEILRRLRSALASFDGYVGINNHMGSKFTSDTNGMLVVLQELNRRGLMFLDSQTSTDSVAADLAESLGMPSAKRSVFIDHDQDATAVRRSLNQLEVTARHFGVAVGIGHPHRVTLDALAEWLPGLQERGFQLVPISAVAKMRMNRDRPAQVAASN